MTSTKVPEQQPLLHSNLEKEKWFIVCLVSWCAFQTHFMARCFYPLVPDISKDLESDASVISLGISLPILFDGFGLMIAATYSTYYGRRPVYLCGLLFTCIGSLGVSLARSPVHVVLFRICQSFGASPAWTLGPAVVSDIFQLAERGTGVGVFRLGFLTAAVVAPICGGLASRYLSWRTLEQMIFAANVLTVLLAYCYLPETNPAVTRIHAKNTSESTTLLSQPREFWSINPLRPLALLRRMDLLLLTLASTLSTLTGYTLIAPMAYTMASRYGITNPVYMSLLYVPSGLGNIIGAPLSGLLSDFAIRGRSLPEDRLRNTLIPAGIFVPLSTLIFGFLAASTSSHSEHGWDMMGCIACLFINGLGDQMVLSPISTYNVDVMRTRSAESSAANIAVRAFFLSCVTTGVLPLVNAIGVTRANAIGAGLAWIGLLLLLCVIFCGDKIRSNRANVYSIA